MVRNETTAKLVEVATFAELLGALDQLRAEYAPARLVCTLDDVNQCLYTSAHASEDERIAYYGDENPEAEVAHVASALENPEHGVEWQTLPGQRIGGGADVAALVTVNSTPDRWLDDVVLVRRASVARDDLVIAAVPNGYFTSDWDTFQNHAVIRRMAAHGYRHFGVGASLLGFDRQEGLSESGARAVVADLVHLYGAPDSASWVELATVLTGARLLLLGYTENLPDLVED
ncbi:hypothetical protein CLV71_101392 [Actinophytocola oryzae]|uniref:Uncharacterized protein n=1 Tax=Actinophytocola oryzae TaxID=502181 RepID=A0A4V3FV27_9PSEU|nr:hypothetical protein CLV71_101392 [Actinophytocola oryzae]